MEMENQQLKLANLKQAEQILNLQDKLQCKWIMDPCFKVKALR